MEQLRKSVAVLALTILSVGPVATATTVASASPLFAESDSRSLNNFSGQKAPGAPRGLFVQALSRLPAVKPGANVLSFTFSLPAQRSEKGAPQRRLPLSIEVSQRQSEPIYFPYNPKDAPALAIKQYQAPEIKNDLGKPTLSDGDIGGASLNF